MARNHAVRILYIYPYLYLKCVLSILAGQRELFQTRGHLQGRLRNGRIARKDKGSKTTRSELQKKRDAIHLFETDFLKYP
jgi:hypothetical protein